MYKERCSIIKFKSSVIFISSIFSLSSYLLLLKILLFPIVLTSSNGTEFCSAKNIVFNLTSFLSKKLYKHSLKKGYEMPLIFENFAQMISWHGSKS